MSHENQRVLLGSDEKETFTDISRLIALTRGIPRFLGKGYTEEIFGSRLRPKDTVYDHLVRCNRYIDQVCDLFPWLHKPLVKRISVVHDIHELATSDTVGPDKGKAGLSSCELASQEWLSAEGLLEPQDFLLWKMFDLADSTLKAGHPITPHRILPEAFIAVVVDKHDGNTTFTSLLTSWMKSDHYDPDVPLPPKRTLEFSFTQYQIFIWPCENSRRNKE